MQTHFLHPWLNPPVMPARVAGIHVGVSRQIDHVDGRDKSGHDEFGALRQLRHNASAPASGAY
jgi:hypothetical protein